jgi:pyrimidine operon attenuation protein / uracil phosphoribosyltransferase
MDEVSSRGEDAASAHGAATVVLREGDLRRALTRIAHEIAERNASESGVCLVGIHRRGAFLASRLRDTLSGLLDCEIPLGDLDIGFYRDDVASRPESPILHASHIDFDVTGRTVVVVDDVLYTGRTVRAAIEALFDYGRPQRVQLAVLVDRGHRELPLRPDYVGKNLPTATSEHVHVRVTELDGRDEVAIAAAAEARV